MTTNDKDCRPEFEAWLASCGKSPLMWNTSDAMLAAWAAASRAQREALERVEAERDALRDQVVKSDAVAMANHFACDAAQAQLAEAVWLMQETERVLRVGDGYGWEDRLANNLAAFLTRHAQAEQQEAQGAQAGMELVGYANFDQLDNMLDDRTATLHPKRSGFAGTPVYRASAALATQTSAGEPVAWMTRPRKGSHEGREFLCQPDDSLNLDQWEKPFPVYAVPPAAAHGDEAVRFERADVIAVLRKDLLAMSGDVDPSTGRSEMECLLASWLKGHDIPVFRKSLYAMRAQGDGGKA